MAIRYSKSSLNVLKQCKLMGFESLRNLDGVSRAYLILILLLKKGLCKLQIYFLTCNEVNFYCFIFRSKKLNLYI